MVRVRAGDEGGPQVCPQEDHAPSVLLVFVYGGWWVSTSSGRWRALRTHTETVRLLFPLFFSHQLVRKMSHLMSKSLSRSEKTMGGKCTPTVRFWS